MKTLSDNDLKLEIIKQKREKAEYDGVQKINKKWKSIH